jgi:DNA invertase Pin-like site-specific DNA recombinase
MKAAIYARVSTIDQHCEMQLKELREYCARRGWKVWKEYVDAGWSGAKASRPALNRALKDASEHRYDCLLVWKLDRFGRSVLNLAEQLGQLNSWGVRFIATTQSLDTDATNPTSRLLLHILAAVAEFEREMIRERVSAGVRSYRDAYDHDRVGKDRHSHSGKDLPVGRPRRIFDHDQALELRARGMSAIRISRKLRVGKGTIQRLILQAEREAIEKAAAAKAQKKTRRPSKKAKKPLAHKHLRVK